MTAYFPTSTTTTNSIVGMAEGDITDVVAGVSLVSTLGDAIIDSGWGNVEVDGNVTGQHGVVISGTVGEVSNVVIGTTGSVTSWAALEALFVGDGTHRITSRGQISCAGGYGVETEGAGVLLNYGSISADLGIVDQDFGGSDVTAVYNYGSVSGAIGGYQNAGQNTINFYNFGDLTGVSYSFVEGPGSGVVHLVNSGKMVGDVILSNSEGDTFANRGLIEGNVELGDGTNVFNSVGGTVDGTITGGLGVDTIHLGNDGETVNGGGGLDQIYGGTGADTFAFSHDGAANAPTIHGFNVVNDTIELSHSLFTKLTAGATPTFSISTVSQSATDHLGYNATAGVLWYDSNGSAAGGWVEIARLAPGLKLTASNFTVV
jgi:Ca2+-binding RTX toxin-like protein